ncbi:MAG: hypothetical protein WBA67_06085 [Jannaschia sp.]
MTSFVFNESGAVTVDWTVLTAALVGLGLATMTLVSGGVEDTSNDINAFLTDMHIVTAFGRVFSEDDFSNGRGAWIGGELLTVNGFGEILALSGRASMAQLPINIGDEHAYAVVEFDMIIADSWDNEQGAISINGQEVLIGSHHWKNDAPNIQTFEGENNTSVTLTRTSTGTGGTWRPGQEDYTYSVRVIAANDGSDMTLAASTTLNQNAQDEFFGIDNVKVKGANKKD